MPRTFAAGSFRAKTFAPFTLAGRKVAVAVVSGSIFAAGMRRRALIRYLLAEEQARSAETQSQHLRKIREKVILQKDLQRLLQAQREAALQEARNVRNAAYAIVLAEV